MLDERQFTFINKDASNIDTKDHITAATSHAQLVTWSLRPRKLNSKKPKQPLSNKSPTSRNKNYGFELLLPVLSDDGFDGDGRDFRNSGTDPKPVLMRKISLSDPTSDSVLHEQLDPFLSLAGSTTLYERNLLHYYLITTPQNLYGTHISSLYCPVRERTAMFVQRCSVWLQCVLLSAEVYKLDGVAAEESISVLFRKALLYKSVREDLSNPSTRLSDSTIDRIMMTAVAENRIGYPTTGAQKHLSVAKGLVLERGDRFERMPITVVIVLIWLGTGKDAFLDASTLNTAIDTFNSSLLAFIKPDQEKPSNSDITCWRVQLGLLNTYTQVRQRAFGSTSPLRPFVEASMLGPSAQFRSHIAILWILNKILWDLRHAHQNSIAFLSQLCYVVANSGATNLKPVTVLFIIMDCVSRMGVPVNEQDHNITDIMMSQGSDDLRIRWWWETVDAVEIILLLTEKSRSNVLGVLSAILIRGTLSGIMVAGEALAEIENEVKLVWSSRRCNTSS
ncbi:hypothetical protein IFR05_006515 [Cadophora sp. M221]|nr:hypothetical protein IFR05_006515 [Cadophora sp. M221]